MNITTDRKIMNEIIYQWALGRERPLMMTNFALVNVEESHSSHPDVV